MAIEFFDDFDAIGRAEYLEARARIRRAVDPGSRVEPPRPHSEAEITAASREAGIASYSLRMLPGERLGLDPARVGVAFTARLAEIAGALCSLLDSPLGRVAARTEVRAEVGLAYVALSALAYAAHSRAGLDGRCEDLREQLNRLEGLLDRSGERGEIENWG